MTNGKKFEKVFGFTPQGCVLPTKVCVLNHANCRKCVFDGFWDKPYKGCFELKLEGDQIEGQIEIAEILK